MCGHFEWQNGEELLCSRLYEPLIRKVLAVRFIGFLRMNRDDYDG